MKVDMEGKGLDFEGDLVRIYGDLRKMMAEKYEETDFGPKEVIEPTVHVEEMNKEEFRKYKRKLDEQQKVIKLGYDRIKAKVKKIHTALM